MLIVAIIASYDSRLNNYKKLWLELIEKVKSKEIKFYFLYNRNNNKINSSKYDLFFNHKETIKDGIILKTLDFFNYLKDHKINYNFLLRTNLSSFFIFDLVLKQLEELPSKNLVYGNKVFNTFPTGCGTFYSQDVIIKILDHCQNNKINYKSSNDDVLIGQILNKIKIDITNYDFILIEEIKGDEKPFFHYRTRQPEVFEYLLNKFYY